MTNGNPPDLSYAEPDLRSVPPDRFEVTDPRPERREPGAGRWILFLGILLLIIGGAWYLWTTFYKTAPAPVVDTSPPPAPTAQPKEPVVQHPIQSGPAEPLPSLAESDKAIAAGLAGAIDNDAFAKMMVNQDFVRRFVITIDNLPRKTYSQRFSPVKPMPGQFGVDRQGDQIRMAPQNLERYALAVRTLEAVNTERLVDLYVRYYPLFQEAYKEQGYPNAYFNDRLVEALDVMIATPAITGPARDDAAQGALRVRGPGGGRIARRSEDHAADGTRERRAREDEAQADPQPDRQGRAEQGAGGKVRSDDA
jgi:hypothetical protein